MPRMCAICLSPYREELMRSWKAHFPRKMLWEKYKPLIWGKQSQTFHSFLQSIYRHEDHKVPGVVVVQAQGVVGHDIDGIAKMMTSLYAQKVEKMTPEDIETKDYIAANKLVLERNKLNLDKNEQLLAIAKLFGLPEVVEPILGEESHAELRSPEDKGDK